MAKSEIKSKVVVAPAPVMVAKPLAAQSERAAKEKKPVTARGKKARRTRRKLVRQLAAQQLAQQIKVAEGKEAGKKQPGKLVFRAAQARPVLAGYGTGIKVTPRMPAISGRAPRISR